MIIILNGFFYYYYNILSFSDDKVFSKLDKSILKEAYSSVVALLLEASKFDAETTSLR